MKRALRAPLKRPARWLRRIALGLLVFFLLLPVFVGAEAATESQQAALQMAQACNGGDVDDAAAEGDAAAGGSDGDHRLSVSEVANLAARALEIRGRRRPTTDQIATATAIAWAESDLNPRAHNKVWPDDSYGLWQINMIDGLGPSRRAALDLDSDDELFSPDTNARAMAMISANGTNWQPWSTYTNGSYTQYMPRVMDAARGAAMFAVASPGSAEAGEISPAGQDCAATPTGAVPGCPAGGDTSGGTESIRDARSTGATLRMANAVVSCFGQGPDTHCYSARVRQGSLGEHPRGRACDFMVNGGGVVATGDDRARGDAIAAWVQAHADELHVLYIIWYNRIWNPSRDGSVPWSQWRSSGKDGATMGHYDHVHVSVHLMSGDSPSAQCPRGVDCFE